MTNQLEALRKITTVVADTGDIEAIKKYQPVDATTNPSLLLKAAQLEQYKPLIEDAVDDKENNVLYRYHIDCCLQLMTLKSCSFIKP